MNYLRYLFPYSKSHVKGKLHITSETMDANTTAKSFPQIQGSTLLKRVLPFLLMTLTAIGLGSIYYQKSHKKRTTSHASESPSSALTPTAATASQYAQSRAQRKKEKRASAKVHKAWSVKALNALLEAKEERLFALQQTFHKHNRKNYTWYTLPKKEVAKAVKKGHTVIAAFKEGEVVVKNKNGTHTFKDCWLGPQTCGEWNWKTFGTPQNNERIRHRYKKEEGGILFFAIEALIAREGPLDILLLGDGRDDALGIGNGVKEKLEELVRQKKIKGYLVLNSQLFPYVFLSFVRKGYRVGGLFHSTC